MDRGDENRPGRMGRTTTDYVPAVSLMMI